MINNRIEVTKKKHTCILIRKKQSNRPFILKFNIIFKCVILLIIYEELNQTMNKLTQ